MYNYKPLLGLWSHHRMTASTSLWTLNSVSIRNADGVFLPVLRLVQRLLGSSCCRSTPLTSCFVPMTCPETKKVLWTDANNANKKGQIVLELTETVSASTHDCSGPSGLSFWLTNDKDISVVHILGRLQVAHKLTVYISVTHTWVKLPWERESEQLSSFLITDLNLLRYLF